LEADEMSVDEFSTACTVVCLLKEAGLSPDLEHCESAVSLAARLLASNVRVEEIEQWVMTRTGSLPYPAAGRKPALSDGTSEIR
jgi:hypothetical protein